MMYAWKSFKIVQTLRDRKLPEIVVNNCEFTNRYIPARIIYFLTERVYCRVVFKSIYTQS